MKIIFVRHGKPDYAHDRLTPEGRLQAAAAARRLEEEGITEIYTSPCGRASETASYTADRLGLPLNTLEFMREITWGGPGIPCAGHPWTLADQMMEDGFDFQDQDWMEHPFFRENEATKHYRYVASEFDLFLAGQGYRHEGRRFLCETDEEKTIALFSHGGSGGVVLAHLLHLPFPYVLSVMPYGLTSIITLYFGVNKGGYVFPRMCLFNDCAHIQSGADGLAIQQ